MRDYGTFPFFNLYVGKDPNESAHGTRRKYIQACIIMQEIQAQYHSPNCIYNTVLIFDRLTNQSC